MMSPAYAAIFVRRDRLRVAVLAAMARQRLDAVLYPHQRRLVAAIGGEQLERNGVLSNGTGFPAMTLPAGFSAPTATAPLGVPIGLELLGREWSEGTLDPPRLCVRAGRPATGRCRRARRRCPTRGDRLNPTMVGVTFRPALDGDFEFLWRLHQVTMRDYVDKTWGWDDAFQLQRFRETFQADRDGLEIIQTGRKSDRMSARHARAGALVPGGD